MQHPRIEFVDAERGDQLIVDAWAWGTPSETLLITAVDLVREVVADIELSRGEAHRLHAWLTDVLGLTGSPVTAPLTASRPHEGGAKESRNALA